MERHKVIVNDCKVAMRELDANSIDSIVTDPPYGLEFMGKEWDHGVPATQFWVEALRVAKPGAYLLAFGGTRTYHRLACAIEDAGWEIRDCVMWVYGSGFPKSMDVSKAIEKSTGTSQTWDGWGTALKPAYEPIIVARKPLCGTVAENVLKHGTGAINIDACRVHGGDVVEPRKGAGALCGTTDGYDRPWKHDPVAVAARQQRADEAIAKANELGRFPANLIHDGSDEVLAIFPETGMSKGGYRGSGERDGWGMKADDSKTPIGYGDIGSAARFFYCAKASKADREEGLDDMEKKEVLIGAERHKTNPMTGKPVVDIPRANFHPTVKPTALMRYLCKLVTQPNGVILDPFMGSGSTGKAAMLEGFRFIGIEMNEEYAKIARARLEAASGISRSEQTIAASLFDNHAT